MEIKLYKLECMKKILILFNTTIVFATFISCEPKTVCTEPKCKYTDVNTIIEAKLTGNLDSIINLGDSIILSIKLPDTLITNYGLIYIKELSNESSLSIHSNSFDSLTTKGYINQKSIPIIPIIYDKFNSVTYYWNTNSNNFMCIIIPNKRGKCFIQINGGKLIVYDNKRNWAINPILYFKNKPRLTQYLNWMSQELRPDFDSVFAPKNNWYCFEVR